MAALTWRNVNSPSVGMSGLIDASKQISGGIREVGDAFTGYQEKRKQEETDFAINALRAAASEEREGLLQSFADSGISMDSKQIGAAASDLDKADLLREQMVADAEYRSGSLGVAQEKLAFDKEKEAAKVAQENSFTKALQGAGGNLSSLDVQAKTPGQRAILASARDAKSRSKAETINNFRVAASSPDYNFGEDYLKDAGKTASTTGKPIGDILASAPRLTEEYIYNRVTSGPVVKVSQDLNNAMDEAIAVVDNGGNHRQASASLRNVKVNLDKAIKQVQDDLVGSNIEGKLVTSVVNGDRSPLGQLLNKYNAASGRIAKIAKAERLDKIESGKDAVKFVQSQNRKHTRSSIETHFLNNKDGNTKDEARQVQAKAEMVIQEAPEMLKGDNQWALVEAIKERTIVGDSWLGTEGVWFPDADVAVIAALEKLGYSPQVAEAGGITRGDIAAEIAKIKEGTVAPGSGSGW